MASIHPRWAFIDALKALAAQLIVLHHLAFYGPMSDRAHALAPQLIDWLFRDARMAVQVFLVTGGFLAAKSLAPAGGLLTTTPLALVWRRYLKLVPPFLVAVVLSIAAAALARTLMSHPGTPLPPTLGQVVAHALLLQSVLGYDGLIAGGWYVAMDFQLYATLLGCLWLARGSAPPGTARLLGPVLVGALTVAAMFYFNRRPVWDAWAVYFFGSYGLGALVYWLTNRPQAWLNLGLLAAVAGASLAYSWRWRLAVGVATALVLGLARSHHLLERFPRSRILGYLGKTSYSLFLVHYPVCLVTNSLFSRYGGSSPVVNLMGIGLAWGASIAAAELFYRYVECRSWKIHRPLRPEPSPTIPPAG